MLMLAIYDNDLYSWENLKEVDGMKKALIITLTILSLLIILDSMNAGHAIAMFLLAGIIPGTNIAISADRMLEASALLIGFTLSRIFVTLTNKALSQPRVATKIRRA